MIQLRCTILEGLRDKVNGSFTFEESVRSIEPVPDSEGNAHETLAQLVADGQQLWLYETIYKITRKIRMLTGYLTRSNMLVFQKK